MDFMNRGGAPQPAHASRPTNEASTAHGKAPKGGLRGLVKAGSFILLVLITVLVAAVLVVIATGNNNDNESKLVDTSKLQAVFLTNGQVYFGNIKSINNDYLSLENIYYLTTNQAVQPNTSSTSSSNSSVSLVKLGCELHAPFDQMTINRSQITFWENLKGDGQVAKAVATYKQQNPNGQNCSTASSTTGTSTGTTGTTTKQ